MTKQVAKNSFGKGNKDKYHLSTDISKDHSRIQTNK
jgi:hypothetical protein